MEDGGLGPCRIIKIPHSLRPWPAAEFLLSSKGQKSHHKKNWLVLGEEKQSARKFLNSIKDKGKVNALVS